MKNWVNTQQSWLQMEFLPPYAPELNPVEGLWSWLDTTQLANLSDVEFPEVRVRAHTGMRRLRRKKDIAWGLLHKTGLFL